MLMHRVWLLRNFNSQLHLALIATVLMVCGAATTARAVTFTGLGDLTGGIFSSYAAGISADGSVVVGRGYGNSGYEAFVWTEAAGMLSLKSLLSDLGVDLTGWNLDEALAVSGDGRFIVGYGTHLGNREGFLVDLGNPVPEPSALTLLLLGVVGFAGVRRRRR